MKTRLFVTLLMLSGLLLAGCTAGLQDLTPRSLSTVAPSKPAITQPGPGLWPTGMPAPPSPTITPASASAVSTAPSQGAGTAKALPPTIPSTNTVATSTTPGWTTYESINDIRDLAFARDGTLWAATFGGLVHWDLNAQTGAKPPYTRYPIRATALDVAPDGSLWLILEQGVCHFDGVSCETYAKADGLIGNDVYAIAVAPDGTVWLGTGQGVSRFDGHSWQSYPSPVATHDLAVTADGEVWAATAGGVGHYLPAEDGWITYTEEHGLPSSNAQVIAARPDGEVWAYLVWEGVYRFDGAGWQKVEGAGTSVFDIAFAADGTPWVATTGGMHYPGGDLSYHDGNQWIDIASGSKLHSFASVALGPGGTVAASTQLGLGLYQRGEWHLLKDGPTSNRVASVAVTPDGAAWFAFGDHSVYTPGWGLSRFDGQEWDYFLDDAEVNALAVGPNGTLWAGIGCSVQRFDGATWEVVARCEDLPAGNILDIDFAPDDAVWVANGFSLAHFDGQSWTVYERLVHSLEVAPDGTIWMNGWEGTQDSHYVACFDGETWTTFKAADSFPGGFMVHTLTSDGLLWGTTPEGRLVSFDGQSWTDGESWTFYESPGGPQDHFVPLTVAPDGALWLATGDAMARFDRESPPDEAWTIYTQDNGLPDSYYRAMAFGSGGEIWFGATRFQPGQAETDINIAPGIRTISVEGEPSVDMEIGGEPPPSQSSGMQDLELVGYLGSAQARAVAVQGHYAYVGIDIELAVVDVSDPNHPQRVGHLFLPGPVMDIALVQDAAQDHTYAYAVAGNGAGLYIIEMADPTKPVVRDNYYSGSYVSEIVVAGGYAYVSGNVLHILDITDPAAPVEVGIHSPDPSTPGEQVAAVVAGDPQGRTYAYTAYGYTRIYGFRIVDVTDPAAPVVLGNLTMSGPIHEVVIVGEYVYLLVGPGIGRLVIVDISDPLHPRETNAALAGSWGSESLAVQDHYLYLVGYELSESEPAGGLQVLDIADPANPVALGRYKGIAPSVLDIVVEGERAYVTAGDGLTVLDVSDPTMPTGIGTYHANALTGTGRDLAVDGSAVYIAAGESGLQVVDASDPVNPRVVGSHDTAGHTWAVALAKGDLPGHTYAYLADEYNGLRVLDVVNPIAPVEVGAYDLPGQYEFFHGVAVEGDYAYVADGGLMDTALRVVNVSDPAHPFEAAFLPLMAGIEGTPPPRVEGVAVADGYVYLAAGPAGLRVIDLADPLAPVEIGTYGTPGRADNLIIAGSYAFIVDGDLRIVDLSIPAVPAEVGFYDLPDLALAPHVAVQGHRAYLTGDGLRILDISSPGALFEVARHPIPQGSVAVASDTVYVIGDGLFILRVFPPLD